MSKETTEYLGLYMATAGIFLALQTLITGSQAASSLGFEGSPT